MDSLTDVDFLSKYDEYKITNKESIEKLIVFLNSLTVNKNYHNKKLTKYYNKRDDSIKSINNFLNKCSAYRLLLFLFTTPTIVESCAEEDSYFILKGVIFRIIGIFEILIVPLNFIFCLFNSFLNFTPNRYNGLSVKYIV